MLGKTDAAKELRVQHRVPQNESMPDAILPMPRAAAATTATTPVVLDDTAAATLMPRVSAFIGASCEARPTQHSAPAAAATKNRKRRQVGPDRPPNRCPRCQKCGHPYGDDEWKEHHVLPAATTNLLNQAGREPHKHCEVPPGQCLPGFPVPDGRKMPQQSRT